mgnify:CR=1 FL=1
MSTVMEMPNAEQLVKRLFKIAEILSRTPARVNPTSIYGETEGENHEVGEIGYCEADDPFMNT